MLALLCLQVLWDPVEHNTPAPCLSKSLLGTSSGTSSQQSAENTFSSVLPPGHPPQALTAKAAEAESTISSESTEEKSVL